jgi:hypothetical protein
VAGGALDQADVEDELYGAAERNGLIAEDGERQCWTTTVVVPVRACSSRSISMPVKCKTVGVPRYPGSQPTVLSLPFQKQNAGHGRVPR